MKIPTQAELEKVRAALAKDFGDRVVTLNGGRPGIRAGMKTEVKAVEGDAPVMDFIGSDSGVDRYNEVIDQTGWQLENFRANPVIPDCHDYSSVAKILGRAQSVQVKDGKLINRVEFATMNPLGNMAYKMAKGGFIKSQSVGFIPMEWTRGVGNDEPDVTYTKSELLEISLVVVPANPGATVGLALKSGALEKSDVKAAVEHLQRLLAPELITIFENKNFKLQKWSTSEGVVITTPKEMTPALNAEIQDALKQFCGRQADSETNAGTTGIGVNDVQLLRIARDLSDVLGRA